METWRKIPGLPDYYEASSLGRLRRIERTVDATSPHGTGTISQRKIRSKIFKLRALSTKGYQRINLCGRIWFVHRLIATAFVPNPHDLPQINHRNGRKIDNRPSNLEWATNQQNRDHAVTTGLQPSGERVSKKLTLRQVESIRALESGGMSQGRIAEMFQIRQQTVSKIARYKSWNKSSLS